MILEDNEIECYVKDKCKNTEKNKLEQLIKCVVIEIKTMQFCNPFKTKRDAMEKIDFAFEWYINHLK